MKTKAVNNLVYPYTESANTVLNFLLRNVKEDIRCSYAVKEISKDKDIFIVNNEYKARNALFATGSTPPWDTTAWRRSRRLTYLQGIQALAGILNHRHRIHYGA